MGLEFEPPHYTSYHLDHRYHRSPCCGDRGALSECLNRGIHVSFGHLDIGSWQPPIRTGESSDVQAQAVQVLVFQPIRDYLDVAGCCSSHLVIQVIQVHTFMLLVCGMSQMSTTKFFFDKRLARMVDKMNTSPIGPIIEPITDLVCLGQGC